PDSPVASTEPLPPLPPPLPVPSPPSSVRGSSTELLATLTRPEASGGGNGAHQSAGMVICARHTPFSPSGLQAAVSADDEDEEEEEEEELSHELKNIFPRYHFHVLRGRNYHLARIAMHYYNKHFGIREKFANLLRQAVSFANFLDGPRKKCKRTLRTDVDIGGANCSSNEDVKIFTIQDTPLFVYLCMFALLPTPPSPTTTNLKVIRLSLFGGRVILPLDPLLLLRPLLRLPILPTLLTCPFSSANTCRMANCLFNPKDPVTIKALRTLAEISSDKNCISIIRNASMHCHLRVKIGNEKLCGKTRHHRHNGNSHAREIRFFHPLLNSCNKTHLT
ncbi:hypothetical protein ALC53_10747, partial [Atta colombica]